jgi:hypothetical protein
MRAGAADRPGGGRLLEDCVVIAAARGHPEIIRSVFRHVFASLSSNAARRGFDRCRAALRGLRLACIRGQKETVDLLLQMVPSKTDYEAQQRGGRDPQQQAAEEDTAAAPPLPPVERQGVLDECLRVAVRHGHAAILGQLLEAGAAPQAAAGEPLAAATRARHLRALRALFAADNGTALAVERMQALGVARANEDADLTALLAELSGLSNGRTASPPPGRGMGRSAPIVRLPSLGGARRLGVRGGSGDQKAARPRAGGKQLWPRGFVEAWEVGLEDGGDDEWEEVKDEGEEGGGFGPYVWGDAEVRDSSWTKRGSGRGEGAGVGAGGTDVGAGLWSSHDLGVAGDPCILWSGQGSAPTPVQQWGRGGGSSSGSNGSSGYVRSSSSAAASPRSHQISASADAPPADDDSEDADRSGFFLAAFVPTAVTQLLTPQHTPTDAPPFAGPPDNEGSPAVRARAGAGASTGVAPGTPFPGQSTAGAKDTGAGVGDLQAKLADQDPLQQPPHSDQTQDKREQQGQQGQAKEAQAWSPPGAECWGLDALAAAVEAAAGGTASPLKPLSTSPPSPVLARSPPAGHRRSSSGGSGCGASGNRSASKRPRPEVVDLDGPLGAGSFVPLAAASDGGSSDAAAAGAGSGGGCGLRVVIGGDSELAGSLPALDSPQMKSPARKKLSLTSRRSGGGSVRGAGGSGSGGAIGTPAPWLSAAAAAAGAVVSGAVMSKRCQLSAVVAAGGDEAGGAGVAMEVAGADSAAVAGADSGEVGAAATADCSGGGGGEEDEPAGREEECGPLVLQFVSMEDGEEEEEEEKEEGTEGK